MESATNWIIKLKYNIIVANVTKIKTTDTYISLKIKRAADSYKLLKFFEEWQKNQATNKYIDQIFSTLGNKISATAILNWYGSATEYGYYSEEMLDAILKMLYSEVSTNALKTKEECIRWRKEESISEYIKNQINFLFLQSLLLCFSYLLNQILLLQLNMPLEF